MQLTAGTSTSGCVDKSNPLLALALTSCFRQGANVDWQLGNGKRSNSPLPLTLGALPRSEAVINAKRMQLSPPKKVNGYKAEETICCGANTTAVYYKKL